MDESLFQDSTVIYLPTTKLWNSSMILKMDANIQTP